MAFKNRFKQLREAKKVSQEKMANDLNIPRTSIANYEREGRLPRKERLKEIADYFGVSIDYLVGRTDQKELTNDEKEFLSDVDEMELEHLVEKYKITIDGKEATEDEIQAAIAFVKSLRAMKK